MTTPSRALCPTSAAWHGRHYVVGRRWRIVAPDDTETVLCSVACLITWLVSLLPADLGAGDRGDTSTRTRAGEAA